MKLVIFDLDQTLVNFISVHDQATHELFKKWFGVDARLTEVDFAGRSLLDNFAELAAMKGIPQSRVRERGNELLASYEQIFGELLSKFTGDALLPGVKHLLDELSKTDNIIALYTGDSPGIVEQVFRLTGLARYFRLAVYSTEADSRPGMLRLAIERAERISGKKFKGKDVVVIGDSVRDVDSGKELNALTIAVSTGFHSPEELARHKPDFSFLPWKTTDGLSKPSASLRCEVTPPIRFVNNIILAETNL